jgi:hypothetical protein
MRDCIDCAAIIVYVHIAQHKNEKNEIKNKETKAIFIIQSKGL